MTKKKRAPASIRRGIKATGATSGSSWGRTSPLPAWEGVGRCVQGTHSDRPGVFRLVPSGVKNLDRGLGTAASRFARRGRGSETLAAAVLAAEFVDSPGGIHDFLLSGIERVAGRAGVHIEGARLQSRPGSERITATAGHGDVLVSGMNVGFHETADQR